MLKVTIGTGQRARPAARRSPGIQIICRYFVAAIGAWLAFSSAAMADIGPGFFRAVGGTGAERDVCWQVEYPKESGWVPNGGKPLSGDRLIYDAGRQLKGFTYEGSKGDPNLILVRDKSDRHLLRRYRAVPCPPPTPATSAPVPTSRCVK